MSRPTVRTYTYAVYPDQCKNMTRGLLHAILLRAQIAFPLLDRHNETSRLFPTIEASTGTQH